MSPSSQESPVSYTRLRAPGSLLWLAVAFIWSLVLILPRPRGLVYAFLRPWPNYTSVQWGSSSETLPSDDSPETEAHRYHRIKLYYPDDIDVPLALALSLPFKDQTARLHKLTLQRPADPALCAAYVRAAADVAGDRAIPGPLSNPNWPKAPPPYVPLSKDEKENLENLAAAARRGQTLEPRNGYFDWFLINALLQLGRRKETLEALSLAAAKPDYNDHLSEAMLATVRVRSLEHSLAPQDLMSIDNASSWFGGLAGARITSRHVMEIVIQQRAAGKPKAALAIAVSLMRLSHKRERESSSVVGSLVGQACEAISIRSCQAPNFTRPRPPASLSNPGSLPGFAVSLGEKKIANEALSEDIRLRRLRARQPRVVGWTSLSAGPVFAATGLCRCLNWFVISARVLLPLWVITSVAILLTARRCELPLPRPFDVNLAAAAAIGSYAVFLSVEASSLVSNGNYLAVIFGNYAPWLDRTAPNFALWLPFFVLAFTVLACHNHALRKQRSATEKLHHPDAWGTHAHPGFAFFVHGSALVIRLSLWIVALASLFSPVLAIQRDSDAVGPSLCLAFFILPALSLWQLLLWPRLRPPGPISLAPMALLQQALSRYFAVSLILLGLGILALTPAAASFQRSYENVIQKGDWPITRDHFGL